MTQPFVQVMRCDCTMSFVVQEVSPKGAKVPKQTCWHPWAYMYKETPGPCLAQTLHLLQHFILHKISRDSFTDWDGD